ncbi:hypothetical protein B4N84_16025 [Flavobacterium sp. IR1]|nr:hypothetical protein B4N84_16025 [Flavobacterium sp. IR1]
MKIKTQDNFPQNNPETSDAVANKNDIIPIMDALYVINGKWRIPIMITLMEGSKRFGEIQKEIDKITSKVLAHELKEMELNSFVEKKTCDESPLRAEYTLTQYSLLLEPVLSSLRDFGILHRKKIREQAV